MLASFLPGKNNVVKQATEYFLQNPCMEETGEILMNEMFQLPSPCGEKWRKVLLRNPKKADLLPSLAAKLAKLFHGALITRQNANFTRMLDFRFSSHEYVKLFCSYPSFHRITARTGTR